MSTIDRKVGRPAKNQSRAVARENRVPVSGNRDILTVLGKDPAYVYRWVLDQSENGTRIHKFLQAGYTFVDADGHNVGESMVYKSSNIGSILRTSAGDGRYNYLMRIDREWYEDDQKAKMSVLDEAETEIKRARSKDNPRDDGQYGEIKLNN